jgi:hypothetical protein
VVNSVKQILGDDTAFNNLLIYRRRFSKKCYYFFSTNKEDPPPSNKDWAVSPSVVSVVAPISVAFKTRLKNIMQGQSDTSSLGKTRTNPAINQTSPNNKRNNNHKTPDPTYPTLACITPDDVMNESVFQSSEAFSMFLGMKKKQMRISILILKKSYINK